MRENKPYDRVASEYKMLTNSEINVSVEFSSTYKLSGFLWTSKKNLSEEAVNHKVSYLLKLYFTRELSLSCLY